MIELEKDIESKLRKMIKLHKGMCLKWVCPGLAGVPDRIILLPGGRVIFAETKRPKGGELSSLQKWVQKQLRQLGFWVVVVWTEEDVRTLNFLLLNEVRP